MSSDRQRDQAPATVKPEEEEVTVLEDYVKLMAQNLVEQPEDVVVEATEEEDRDYYLLSVAAEDLGRVIGKDGRNVKAMRTLLTAVSARKGRRAVLEVSNDPSTGEDAGGEQETAE